MSAVATEIPRAAASVPPAVDSDRLNAFIGRFVGDLGAAFHAGMVVIGEELGLYKALAAGPMTAPELAKRTGTDARYVREWLSSQAAGGYVTYDAASDEFSLSPEQALALAAEDSPAYLPGAFQLVLGSLKAVPRITESPLSHVVVTNTIPLSEAGEQCSKVRVKSVGRLLGEAIKRIHHGDSISSLFV